MACRAFKIRVKKRTKIRWGGKSGFRGRNPKFEAAEMYTGTLIKDLMATVERAERVTEQRRIAEARELHEIFSMQILATPSERAFMGAA
jgi:hypothetical protein